MKITRALLLSSKKQAEAWEQEPGWLLFPTAAPRIYRFLVSRVGEGLVFQIFCVHQEMSEEQDRQKKIDVVAEHAHVEIDFEDMGRLINFLRRYQIDFEKIWQPVEEDNHAPHRP